MSLPRYERYKDSGISWVGEMPSHWQSYRMKALFELMRRPPREVDGVVTAFRDGEVTLRSNRRTDGFTNSVQEIGYQGIRTGDLVIHAMDAFAGAIGVSDSDGKSTPVYSVCKPRPELANAWYYGRLLRYMALSGYIDSLAKGIRERSTEFRWAEASNVFLPVPPVPEQTAIVAFLDRETGKIDALIFEQEKLIALLAEKRQATISHTVTRGLNPGAPMKDSGVAWLGEVPACWTVQSIKHLVSTPITDGPHETPNFPDEGIPFVSAEAVSGGFIDFEKIRGYISAEDHQRYSAKYKPQLHDIYMVKSGATTGVTAIVESETDFNIWSPLAAIRCNKLKAEPYFVLAALRSRNFQEGVALNWSFGTQQNIGMGVLGDLPIALPPLTEQREIAAFLALETSKLHKLGVEAERTIALLKERRSALIAAAVTGRIDVRNTVVTPLTEEAALAA